MKPITIGTPSYVCTAVIAALCFSSPLVSAQELAEENKEKQAFELIEVTAQKRVQNVMKVPVTVSTVSAQLLEESASILLSDVDKFVPGFEFSDGNMTQAGIRMRGISSPNISVGGDPSSASFYDDTYMPRAAQNVLFSDIERVEVLKGPQGTLFGRNAAMGVVSVIPVRPQEDYESFVKASLGTDDLVRLEGMFNAPLSDSLFMRANLLSNKQDGIVENIARPKWNKKNTIYDLGERQHLAAKISLLWQASSDTQVYLSYDHDDLEQGPPMAVGTSEFAYAGGTDPFTAQAENDVREGVESRDMYGVIGKVLHDFNDQWSMKFVASKRDWQTVNREDEDGTADITRYFDTSNNEDSDIFYSELQFSYVSDRINAVTGVSYSKENVSQQTELNLTTDTIARLVTGEINGQVRGQVAAQLAAALGGTSDDIVAAVFGPGATFEGVVDQQFQGLGFPMDHMWNADEWANALTALGAAGDIMAAIGFPDAPLTGFVVNALGDLTYDLVASELGDPIIFGPSYAGQFWQENVFNTGTFTNIGVYADIDYAVTEKWHVIAGIRYSSDDKDFTWFIPENSFAQTIPGVANQLFPQVNIAASDSWSKVTGRLVTNYQLDNDQMIFASYSTGYKSGGFDSLVPVDQSIGQSAFAPEDTTNFEVGYKATLWDSVRVNLAFFDTQLDNFQVAIESRQPGSNQAIPSIINENREIKGFEAEVVWQATDSVRLGLITEIRSTDVETPEFYDASGELVAARKESFDADTNYTLMFDWTPDLPWGIVNVHFNYRFEENTNDQNPGIQDFQLAVPAYFKDIRDLDGRISWSDFDEKVEVGLWARNITDERYVLSLGGRTASVLGTPFARINRGRELGIDFKYRF
ncbi:TonB-dependent receptor [Alteromonas sediminis]|uniref:TonB-dependent receptor n=1 Tax=Alteromonas sediminis TaxID=2259342 RepID=A0A3N5Y3U6_9ALTE|nr:TonB-dependent receptor [Alteromonas sediminis]RPJ68040.1 TonB-dependent receptor [Alteromonas sediminis]